MSSKSRKFRRKPDDLASVQDTEAEGSVEAAKIAQKKEKKEKPKKVSLLSFDEEEGGSPLRLRAQDKAKSKAKVRPNLQSLSLKEEAKPISTQQSGAGEHRHFQDRHASFKAFLKTRQSSQNTFIHTLHHWAFVLQGNTLRRGSAK